MTPDQKASTQVFTAEMEQAEWSVNWAKDVSQTLVLEDDLPKDSLKMLTARKKKSFLAPKLQLPKKFDKSIWVH